MQKFLDYFNKLNEQTRYALVVVVIFMIILLDVVFLMMPQINDINNVNDKIRKLSDDTQQVITDRPGIGNLKKRLNDSRDSLRTLSDRMRTVQEIPAILTTISSIANQYGVNIDELVPEKSLEETLASSPDGKYISLPVTIKARCGYHKFGYFLNKLENEELFFIMKDFIIQNDDKDANSRSFALTMNLILVDHNPGPDKK